MGFAERERMRDLEEQAEERDRDEVRQIRIKLGTTGGGTFSDEMESWAIAFYLIGVYSAGGTLLEIERVED